MKKNILRAFSFLLIVIGFQACYERTNGCLDPNSTNYDITVDDACEDCCTYPILRIQFTHEYKGRIIRPLDALEDDFGHFFFLKNFGFFINNVKLLSQNDELRIRDSIEITQDNESMFFFDDMILVNQSTSSYEIGSVEKWGSYDVVSFDIGLTFKDINFETLPLNHLLLTARDSNLYVADQFVTLNASLIRDTNRVSDFINFEMPNFIETIEIEKEINTSIAQDVVIPISIKYKDWFEGISFENDTKEMIIEKLKLNTTKAFIQ